MYIKADLNSFKTLLRLMPTMEAERLAVHKFRKNEILQAGNVFALADVSLKIAKGILSAKKKLTLTNTEACSMLWYCAEKEREHEFDYYTQNVLRQVKLSLHEQLTNYRSKY